MTIPDASQLNQQDTVHRSDGTNGHAEDDNPLSQRELEVAAQLVTGATNTEIARELVISPHTVKVHLRNIYEKLDVNSRTEASLVLLQNGWVSVPGVEATAPDAAAIAASEPEPQPEPVTAVGYSPSTWQRVYILVAAAIVAFLLIAPVVSTGSNPSFELLTDANRTVFGQTAPVAVPRWSARTPLPQARSRHAAALVDDLLYVIGGEGAAGDTLDSFSAYDMGTNRWQALEPLPTKLENLAATQSNGVIFVAGGSTNSAVDSGGAVISNGLYAYNTGASAEGETAPAVDAEDGWQLIGDLPVPLAGAGLGSYENALYLVGGWDGEHMRDEVWKLDLTSLDETPLQWKQVSQLAIPAAFFGNVVVNSEMYIIGGYDGQRELADSAVLDLTRYEWRELPPLSVPRSGLSAVYDGMAVFALGGGWTRAVNTHERYDELAGQWSNFPSPYEGDWRHLAAVSSDGRIWLIGGWSGGYLDTQQEYQSAFRALLPVIQND